jgi:hypothetical protein
MNQLTRFAATFVIFSSSAFGQEKWSYKDGKSADLELVLTFKKEGDLVGEFKNKEREAVTIKESELVETDATRMREFKNPGDHDLPLIQAAITKLRDGKELTQEEIESCEAERAAYYKILSDKNGTGLNTGFAKYDQCDCYIMMIKMALITYKNHGGWPFRSTLRLLVAEDLKKIAENTNDPFIHFCSIFPSLSKRDVKHAVSSYLTIRKSDPFLADIAEKWTKQHLDDSETKTEFMKAAGME